MRILGYGVIVLVMALAMAARGQEKKEDKPEQAATESQKRMEAMFAGMTKFVGDTRLTEKGIKSLLQHWESFDAVGASGEDEDEVQKSLDKSYEKSGTYDFGAVLKHPLLQKWATKTGVDAKAWMQQYMRAMTIFMRAEMLASDAEMKAQAKQQLAELEKVRKQMGEEQYQAMKKLVEQGIATAKSMAKAAKKIPEPDKAEQALLEKYGDKLRATLDEEDDGEDEYDDEDDHEDDEEDDDDG